MTGVNPTLSPTQLGPEDKFPFGDQFSYAKAIIKDEVTYPIVPNCPIISVDNPFAFDVSNIPVGTFFITRFQDGDFWMESLCLRVPDDTTAVDVSRLGGGFIVIDSRMNRDK